MKNYLVYLNHKRLQNACQNPNSTILNYDKAILSYKFNSKKDRAPIDQPKLFGLEI